MDNEITFGIDQSYANFAVVVFKGKEPVDVKVIHTGSNIDSNLKKDFGEYFPSVQQQLIYVYSEFKDLFLRYHPTNLVFEGLSFGSKGDRVFQLGGLFYYVATKLFEDLKFPPDNIRIVAPTRAKHLARSYLPEEHQFLKDQSGGFVFNKNKTKKKNPMKNKKFVKMALQETDHGWLLDGYTTSSIKKETGAHDIPDAYFIGLAWITGSNEKV